MFHNKAVIISGVISVMDDDKLNDHTEVSKLQEYTCVIAIH
jgi:hypothetical protein